MTDETHTRRRVLQATAGAAAVALAGCTGGGGDGGTTPTDSMGTETDTTSTGTDSMGTEAGGDMAGHELALSVSGLPELMRGHYEGWAVFGDEKVSTGTFAAGDDLTFTADRDLREADSVVVTVEPDDDPSPSPSGVVLLSGAVESGAASLSFPVGFDDAAGSYILATPSTESGDDERSGVWFLDPSGPSPALDLPELPAGWVYEGWVVAGGRPLSTGRFSAVDEPDGFSGYTGTGSTPPFPGEDFVTNAPDGVSFPLDLADGGNSVVVSVEPDIDGTDPTGAAPFAIKPLVGEVPDDATDHTSYDLSTNMGTLPSGSAEIR